MYREPDESDKEAYKAALIVKEYCRVHLCKANECKEHDCKVSPEKKECIFAWGFDCLLHGYEPAYWRNLPPIERNGMFD